VVEMLDVVVLTCLGGLLALPYLCLLFVRFCKHGRQVFQVEQISKHPEVLCDEQLGEHKYASVNGVKLHYVESGSSDKPLILFVHGFPEFWFSWRHQIKHFNKDYYVVAMDMRGYGDSSKPAGVHNYKMTLLVEDIRALVTSLGKTKFHLVAHDWGGAVSWRFVAEYPQMIKTYSACNIPHPLALKDQWASSWKQRIMSSYILFFQCPVLPECFFLSENMRFFNIQFRKWNQKKDSEEIQAFKYSFQDFTAWNRPINYYRASMRSAFNKEDQCSPGKLENIKVPVLQVFGTADKFLTVEAAQGSAKYVTDQKVELLNGVSHWVQQEDPAGVNIAIENFIKNIC